MLCKTVNVVVGFLYILNVCLLFVFVMARSRKFMLLLTSVSKVEFNLWTLFWTFKDFFYCANKFVEKVQNMCPKV